MTREEAIRWLKHINITDFGWDDYAMQDSQKEIRERCEQSTREAIDLAIEALQTDAVMRDATAEERAGVQRYIDSISTEAVQVVRCKDCKWQKFIDWGMGDCLHPKGSRHIAFDNHYCSYGERREE